MTRPMLDGVELPQAQRIASEDEEVLAQHGVPALEGDFLQDLGRRAVRVTLTGVLTGSEAGEGLKGLREKFHAAEPVPFVSDIATATRVDKVLIEEMGVRELAGKTERFEYALALREYIPPPAVTEEVPPVIPPPPVPVTATLVVEVIVEGEPDFDFSRVRVTATGPETRTLANRTGNVWTEPDFPPGSYTVEAVVDDPDPMTGSAPAEVREGETTEATITLSRDRAEAIAKAFVIHFWFDKAFVEPCLREVLQRVVAYSDAHPDEKMLIVGHTDLVGSDDYNQSLSERRGRSVHAFLTFDNDRDSAVREWNELRRRNLGGLVTLHDTWGTREVQYMLQDLGYYTGNIDEQHGPATDAAIRSFQTDHGLVADGILGDATWEALVEAYLEQDSFSIPEERFFPNAKGSCDGGIVKWLGCGEQDPVRNTQDAWRPNRRTEILFVKADSIPCEVAKPVTFDLPEPGAVGSSWCLGPGNPDRRCCFLTRGEPQEGKWQVQPAEPGRVRVQGVITFEDGTPVANAKYALLAPDGEYLHTDAQGNPDVGERPQGPQRGRPIPSRADAEGRFSYPKETPEGVYILEILDLTTPQVARTSEDPPSSAIGNVVCARLEAGAGPTERSGFVEAAEGAEGTGSEPLHGIIEHGPGGDGPPRDDPDPGGAARWFLPPPDPKSDPREGPVARFAANAGNEIKFYLSAPEVYADMRKEIELTQGTSDLIYILGWDLGLDTPMGGKTLRELLKEADGREVPVRAMLNLNQSPGPGVIGSGGGPPPDNKPAVAFINNAQKDPAALAHGGAIHDNRYLNFGTHHQKVLVVQNQQRLVAFCGGVDIHPSRQNWHDAHCRIVGPAARDLHDTFSERWNDFPHKNFVRNGSLVALRSATSKGDLHAQVVRTYGDGSKHGGLGLPDFPPPGIYAFAPNGEQNVYHLIANAIRQTRKFIYLEDQYLVEETSMSGPAPGRPQQALCDLLRARVDDPDFERLIILIARTESVQAELFQAWERRRRFIQMLKGANPAKVTVCQYRIARPAEDVGTENPRYVHAKTWIFDDKFAIVGSANCNRRGYTHDSEVAVGVFDENLKGDRLYFAHRLRMAQWSRHLNLPKDRLVDPIASASHWTTPPAGAPIELYNEDPAKSPAKNPQPDRRIPTNVVTGQILANLDDDWNIVIDPDGS